MNKCSGSGRRRILTGGDVWLHRFVAVIAKPNLHTRLCAIAQSGTERSLQRIAEPHVADGKIESLLCCANERGQPRHDRVRRLFALSKKENGKSIQESDK